MLALHKLKTLPYTQGLRKSAKIFEESERKYLEKGKLTENEIVYLAEILTFWENRTTQTTGKALAEIRGNLKRFLQPGCSEDGSMRRSLNSARHLLGREAGFYPSEWDFDNNDAKGLLDPSNRSVSPGMEVYLEDIRSPFNIGAIFRGAESFGVEKIYLSQFSADPEHKRAQRTAMGCVSVLPWERMENDPFDPQCNVSASGFFSPETAFFALETGGTRLEDFTFPKRGIMIVGSEELGVSPHALAKADASLGRVSIPILGAKGSLNVAVAFGIAVHAWAKALRVVDL